MSLGNCIDSIRIKHKLSQGDLALHASVFGRYEQDEAIPSVEIAARIAKALEISLYYLIELTEVELYPIVLKRIKDITSLSNEDRDDVFTVVDALIRDIKAKK